MELITDGCRFGVASDSGQPPHTYTFNEIVSQQLFSPHDQSGYLNISSLGSISSSAQFNSASQFGVINDYEPLHANISSFNDIDITSAYSIPRLPPVSIDKSLYTDFFNDIDITSPAYMYSIRVLPSIINDVSFRGPFSYSSTDPKDITSFLPTHQTDVASEPLSTNYFFEYQPDTACERSAELLPPYTHQILGHDGRAHGIRRSTGTGVLCCGSGCRGNLM